MHSKRILFELLTPECRHKAKANISGYPLQLVVHCAECGMQGTVKYLDNEAECSSGFYYEITELNGRNMVLEIRTVTRGRA